MCFSPVFRHFVCDFEVPYECEFRFDYLSVMQPVRQSGETISSALPEPILNVDMLIVTFKFLPLLTAHENALHLSTVKFEVSGMIFQKFTVCSWRFSLLHSFNTGFLLMMTAISDGEFLGNGIAFSGLVWYNR